MPPVVTPVQSSRAGLITVLIISVIVAVTMIVVAVYFSQQLNHAEAALNEKTLADKPYIPENAPSDPRITALTTDQVKQKYPGLNTAMEVSLAQTEQLAKRLSGDASADVAAAKAESALADATTRLKGLNSPVSKDTPLTTALTMLTSQIVTLANDNQQTKSQLAAAEQKNQQVLTAQSDLLKQKDQLIQEANAKVEAAEAKATQYKQEAEQKTAALEATANGDLKKVQQTVENLTKEIQTRDKRITSQAKEIGGLRSKLHLFRVNPNEPEVQHADGQIVRVNGTDTVFINIGHNQSVTPGLTFEVYDKNKGIPPLGEGAAETNLPVGKGSIEVFRVGPDSSECRVIHVATGEQFVIGDPIVNLVFDPNIKYNFVVYGNFDLTNSGIVTPTDTEVVKRLITQWGGKLQDHVDVDTDFVVMGKEPTAPGGGDPNDPAVAAAQAKYKRELAAYQEVLNKAGELSVPILNQNRFLYFIGYYDQAQR